jgi:hypothetical protein
MNEIDYEELIRSPLDDLEGRSRNGWGIAVAGAAFGLLLGYLFIVGLGGREEPTVGSTDAPATTLAPPVFETPDYPPGYVEIAPDLAARVEEVILGEEIITVAFSSAVKRGSDPTVANWPVGGNWLLESAAGTTAASERVVVGRSNPGAFAVQFAAQPFNGETTFTEVQAFAFWGVDYLSGSIEAEFDGEPFTAPETLTSSVNHDVTLIVPKLTLGRFLGSVEWQTTGADLGTTMQIEATLLDENGDVIGSFRGFPGFVEPADHGISEINWSEPFPTGQEGAVSLSLDYTVGVVSEVPVSLDFDLSSVAVGR